MEAMIKVVRTDDGVRRGLLVVECLDVLALLGGVAQVVRLL